MNIGTVKFFNESKGFGLIVDNNTGDEIFFNSGGLIDNIREGDVVSFDIELGKKGLNATKIKRAS